MMAEPQKQGCMIVVVGPSGVGKDSVMSWAARFFADDPSVHFVRRMITRPADAGSEDHDSIDPDVFDAMRLEGGFAVSWEAHGLKYGIPAETRDLVQQGGIVVANGSRAALKAFQAAYPNVLVVLITARPDVLAARLIARGRETEAEILDRLSRTTLEVTTDLPVVTIDNSADLATAGERLIAIIQERLII
jgi:ribose 1,5-bisphosphokinase